MKASELRIGNLIKGIYHDYDDGIDEEIENETLCKVVTLDASGSGDYTIYVYSDEDIENFSDFEPIPLTEEWLLKFGFIKHGKYGYFYLDNFIIDKNKLGKFFMCDIDIHVEIETVHHLQNLYFALTGEELTLKP